MNVPTKTRAEEADAVAAARAYVLMLATTERELAGEYLALREQRQAAVERRGAAMLAERLGERPGSEAPDIGLIDEQLTALQAAIQAAREKREVAVRAVYEAEAAAHDAKIERMRIELAEIENAAAPLVAKLEAVWGVSPVPGGAYAEAGDGQVVPLDEYGRPQAGGPVPRPLALQVAMKHIQRTADNVRGRQPHKRGQERAASVAGLVEALFRDPLRIGPSAVDVVLWAAEAEATEREKRRTTSRISSKYARPHDPVEFVMVWVDGELDRQASRCGVQGAD